MFTVTTPFEVDSLGQLIVFTATHVDSLGQLIVFTVTHVYSFGSVDCVHSHSR